MYVCQHVYVTYTFMTYMHLGSIQPLKEGLNLRHFDIFLNFYSNWLRAGYRTWYQIFLHDWSKILDHSK